MRIFACFGADEPDARFIKSCIRNIKNNDDIVIFQDKYFDFFYVGDVNLVIEKILKNDPLIYKDTNLCYNNKLKLSEVASIIRTKMNSNINIVIEKKSLGLSYTGDSTRLDGLSLPLTGLDKALDKYLTTK